MPPIKQPDLSPEQKKRIEEKLISIFKDIYLNNPNILKAKSESDLISEEIRKFILSYVENSSNVSEVDLLLKAKEKGLELVQSHDLIFFDEEVANLQMRAFLIPGMRVEFSDESANEKVTDSDIQSVDHELCVSFKRNDTNEFTKLGNLLDIRANLAKALSQKSKGEKEVVSEISNNMIFNNSLENTLATALKVLGRNR